MLAFLISGPALYAQTSNVTDRRARCASAPNFHHSHRHRAPKTKTINAKTSAHVKRLFMHASETFRCRQGQTEHLDTKQSMTPSHPLHGITEDSMLHRSKGLPSMCRWQVQLCGEPCACCQAQNTSHYCNSMAPTLPNRPNCPLNAKEATFTSVLLSCIESHQHVRHLPKVNLHDPSPVRLAAGTVP